MNAIFKMAAEDAIIEVGRPETQEAPVELSEIRRGIARLPVNQREALLLHWLHGCKYEEVATKLKLTTVQTRKMRAIVDEMRSSADT